MTDDLRRLNEGTGFAMPGEAPGKVETIEDVRAALAQVRGALAEVQTADLTPEGAEMLFEPLLDLQAALTKTSSDIAELLASRGLGGEHRPSL